MKPSVAEDMIDLAEALLFPRNQIVGAEAGGALPDLIDRDLARFKTSIDFYRSKPSFKFRAIVERWSARRIIRELY